MGTRSLDILHVAFALESKCGHFITCDQRQFGLAKAAGLKATLVSQP
jgi:predicted nucleic acid-binding protein